MIDCCKPRNIYVVVLLLVIATETETVSNCTFFDISPITTVYNYTIKELKRNLIPDYPVQDFPNLEMDNWCLPIWKLFFSYTTLREIEKKSGDELAKKIRFVINEIKFVEDCSFNESITYIPKNKPISFILDKTIDLLTELKDKIKNDFSNCTLIQYKSDDSSNKTELSQDGKVTEQPNKIVKKKQNSDIEQQEAETPLQQITDPERVEINEE
ncbi:fms-related tyrosine kinase 3 ligand isoform X2 [Mixophyes fleayi]|uniref:fms-related tyrosine kinase 3 ligand isoform X2 n=1 Tax=Mixophyes fleayi TaxID=3061075 RepID=UPI003F4DECFB